MAIRRKPPTAVRSIDEYCSLPSPDPTTALGDVMLLSEAAAFLRCDPKTVLKMARAGIIPSRRAGTGWRFSRTTLTKWMQEEGQGSEHRKDGAA
jgi:excisionase family DNA binding protein